MLALVRLLARQAAREAFDQAVAEFDIVMAEALDRFSRDQEDTAGLFERLTFAGVNTSRSLKATSRICTSGSRGR